MNNIEKKISRFLSLILIAMIFSLFMTVGTAKAHVLVFSEYSSTYGYESLAAFEDGGDRQAVYDEIYAEYRAFWSSTQNLTTEHVANSGHYAIAQIDISGYSLDSSDLLEVYMAFQFDNPIFYYAPTTFYSNSQTMTLVVDEDYITATERQRLNSLVMSKVDEYETAVADLTTDYDKMVAVHDMLLEDMDYAYDDEGNPSDEAWAHNVIGSFDRREGVCESYAKVYQLVMNYLGYESIMVAGTSNGEGHVWNLVKLDGAYYYIDCTWDDTEESNSYLLKGSYEFEFDHDKYTPSGSGQTYQYALPQVSEDNYIKYLSVSCNGGTATNYGNAKLAFDSMTNADGSYVFTVAEGYRLYLPGGNWPTVKEIKIVSENGCSTYVTGDIVANSDIVLDNMYFSTALSHITSQKKLAVLNLGSNSVTFNNVSYIGGYSYGDNAGEATSSKTGVNIIGEDGSRLIVGEYTNGRFLEIGSKLVDVDELVILAGSRCRTLCDEIYANKLILDSTSYFGVGSRLDERTGAVVEFKETIVNNSSASVDADRAYAGTTISLGDVSGTGSLSVDVTCVEEDAYPSININDSDIDISFRLYNKIKSIADTSMGEVITYYVWDDAIDYDGAYLNVGNTDIDKISYVLLDLYKSNNGNEPIRTLYKTDISELCEIDEEGNLYRAYDEKMSVEDGYVRKYVYYTDIKQTNIIIPNNVRIIDTSAFLGCSDIKSVVIPEGVGAIYDMAFAGCSLTEVTLPSTITLLGARSLGYSYDSSKGTFEKIEGFKIYCYNKNSVAVNYAIENGFDYEILPLPERVNNVHQISSTANSVTMGWDKVDGADGYVVARYIGTTLETVGVVEGGSNVTFTVTGLDSLTQYYIYVAAYTKNANNDRILGNWDANYAYPVPAVLNFTYSERTTNSITLKWDEVEGVDGYTLQCFRDGQWCTIGYMSSTMTSYRVEYLSEGTQYKFRVCAHMKDNNALHYEGRYTEATTISTTIDKSSLIITGCTYGGVTTDSITLKWDKNDYAHGYVIEQYKDGKWTAIRTITGNATTNHKVAGLSVGTTYQFRISGFVNDESDKLYGDVSTITIKTLDVIDISKATISISQSSYEYTGGSISPAVTVKVVVNGKTITLTKNTDYTITYSNNVNPGTAKITVTGKGKYKGQKSITFTIKPIDLSKATLTIGKLSFEYTGGYIKPTVTVKAIVNKKTVILVNGTDYKVVYSNAINPGTAKITVTGIGRCKGQKSITYTIKPVDLSKATVTISQPSFGYTGQYIKPVVTVKVKINGKTVTLTNWKDYKVTYKNFKNPGVATITVTSRGITTGTRTLTFQIRPAQVKKLTSSAKARNYITLKWDKCVGVTGYEVYRATTKNGKYTKVGTVTTNTYKNTGLKRKTTYYYKVRAYKTVGATKIYGNYSTVYTVATK